ncbi:unnamed protein product [Caenorhabditis sp. 36 PRJEB53466]|nr:unnamed protein product [Caenorhabditis sp. 36 PRJEB53466]
MLKTTSLLLFIGLLVVGISAAPKKTPPPPPTKKTPSPPSPPPPRPSTAASSPPPPTSEAPIENPINSISPEPLVSGEHQHISSPPPPRPSEDSVQQLNVGIFPQVFPIPFIQLHTIPAENATSPEA